MKQIQRFILKIPYFEMVQSSTSRRDGALLLDKVTPQRAEQYVRDGIASAERRKDGSIRKLWRIPRGRQFISAGACAAFMNVQAVTTAPVTTEEGRLLPHLWRHKTRTSVNIAGPVVPKKRTA